MARNCALVFIKPHVATDKEKDLVKETLTAKEIETKKEGSIEAEDIDAPADSLRGIIAAKWQELGLKAACNTGDNGVHASASPVEALAERMNWLQYRAKRDQFGKILLKAGVSVDIIKEWSTGPQVTFGLLPIEKSIFDTFEDTYSDNCLALCQLIARYAGPPAKNETVCHREGV